ncbi:MAG: TMP-3 domain-containing protein [Eubacteriales bacterium]|jgi:tape measure domain-containing protein
MPSLKSIFTMQNNYDRSMNRIWGSAQRAASGIGQTNAAAMNANSSFTAAEGSAGRLASRLTGLASKFLKPETIQKGMELSDAYINISSRLSSMTSNAAQLKSLQNDIFAAADRARGSYFDMADTVTELGMTAGSKFGSTDNIVKFTETIQKMFRINGASKAEQSAAMLQIKKALGSGELQGGEFQSIMENVPSVAQAMAGYLGKSTDDLQRLAGEGKITSDVLINGVLSASRSTDQQISKMSYTWEDYWNRIKNGAMNAFSGVFDSEGSALGSTGVQSFVNGIVNSFSILAQAANGVLAVISNIGGFISGNWPIIVPIILGAAAAFAVLKAQTLRTAVTTVWHTICSAAETVALFFMTMATNGLDAAFKSLNATLFACPLTWILLIIIAVIAAVYMVIAIINQVTGQTISATGVIVGAVLFLVATIYDVVLGVLNAIIQFAWTIFVEPFLGIIEWVLNAANGGFDSFGGAVANLIGQIIGWFLSLGQVVTKIIDAIFGTNWTSGLESLKDKVTAWGKKDENSITINKTAPPTIGQRWDPKSAWDTGYKTGQGVDSKVKNWMKNLGKAPSQKELPYKPVPSSLPASDSMGKDKPVKVQGTGADGSVKVNIADQDLQYLRDLAEKQYINKFSTAVLSPKLSVSFTGNLGDEDSQKQIYSTISRMLKEELATAAEGFYE